MDNIRELYQEIILEHGRQPRNFGPLTHATHEREGYNPLCGDKIILQLILKDGVIHDVHFQGSGCAISMASASLMTEALKGKDLATVQALFNVFHQLVTQGEIAATGEAQLGKLNVLAGVREFPVRVKCATLAWHTLMAIMHNDERPVSTE